VPALFRLATLSRRVRAFFFGLPASRFRTWTIGQYYRLLVRQFASGDYGFLRAVAPNAELTLFSMETYREQSGWREALTTWRDSFGGGPLFDLTEFVNPLRTNGVVLAMLRPEAERPTKSWQSTNLVRLSRGGERLAGVTGRDRFGHHPVAAPPSVRRKRSCSRGDALTPGLRDATAFDLAGQDDASQLRRMR
jgi:hypothetical protein